MSKQKVFKWIGIVSALFLVILLGLFLSIRAAFPPEKIQKETESFLTETLKRPAQIEKVSVAFWPLGLKISNVRLANNPDSGFSKQALLDLKSVSLKIDVLALFQFKLRINELVFDQLHLNYEILENGKTSVDGLFAPSPKDTSHFDLTQFKLPGTFLLEKFQLKNASVQFWDHKKNQKIILGSINQLAALDLDQELKNSSTQGELIINEIQVEDASLGIKKGNIHISLKHDLHLNLPQQTLKIKEVTAGIQNAQLSVKGNVNQFITYKKLPVFDIDIKSNNIDLAQLIKEVPASVVPMIQKVDLKGSVQLQALLRNKDSIPEAVGSLMLNRISLNYAGVPAGIQNLNGNIAFTQNSVAIRPFALDFAQNPVKLEAEIVGIPANIEVKLFHLNAHLDLGGLVALASQLTTLPQGFSLSGFVNSDIQAQGIVNPAHPELIKVNGTSELQDIKATLPGIHLPIQTSGNLKFGNESIHSDLKTQIGQSDVSVNADVKDWLTLVAPKISNSKTTQVNVVVKSNQIHLDSLLASVDSKPETKNAQSELPKEWPELPKVALNLDVSLNKTTFKHIDLSRFKLNVKRSTTGEMSQTSSGEVLGGVFSQEVRLNILSKTDAQFSTRLNVKNVEANEFISQFRLNFTGQSEWEKQLAKLDNTFFGRLTLDVALSGGGVPATLSQSLTGPIQVQIRDGKVAEGALSKSYNASLKGFKPFAGSALNGYEMKEINFKNFDAALELQKGNILVKDFKMVNTALGDFNLAGLFGQDGSLQLNLKNILPKSISQSILSLQEGAKKALSSALNGTAAASLSQSLDGANAVPVDQNKNVLAFFKLGGTWSHPQFLIDGPKMKEATSLGNKSALEEQRKLLESQAKAKLQDAKNQAEARAKAELEKAKAEATAKAKAEASKVTDKAKEGATKALGNQLKKFGF